MAKLNNITRHQAQKLQALLDQIVKTKPLNHALLRIETETGESWSGGAGQINGSTPDPLTPFFIASIDKLFTATVSLQLIEEKQLSLDGFIKDYIPTNSLNKIHCYKGVDYSEQITLRHLLSHSSGLADWLEDSPKSQPSLIEQLIQQGDTSISSEQIFDFVRAHLTPHFPPSDFKTTKQRPAKIRYSDTNFVLLKTIIEAVCDQNIRDVFQQRLFSPLKLAHTFFAESERHPTATPLYFQGQELAIPQILASINGLYSNTTDLIRFMRALVNQELFKDVASFNRMQTWQRFGFPIDKAALRAPNWPIEYGLGLKRFKLPRWLEPFNPTPAVIGHTGSTGTWLFYCEELGVFISGTVDEITAGAIPFRQLGRILRCLN